MISVFLLQYSYVFIAYLNKLLGIKGFPWPNYKVFEVSPHTQRFPPEGFSQFPPLMGEMMETYLANPGTKGSVMTKHSQIVPTLFSYSLAKLIS